MPMNMEPASPRERLEKCVRLLIDGPWHLIQLRGDPLGIGSIGGDDVDLLASCRDAHALCESAFGWARVGDCHFRVFARDRRKMRFSLISRDGSEELVLDLWFELWQIDLGRRCLTYHNCQSLSGDLSGSISRLPPHLEACVYVHHLASRKKDLSGVSATTRLGQYITACHENGHPLLAAELERILSHRKITRATLSGFLDPLLAAIPIHPSGRAWPRTFDKIKDCWLGMPREIRMVSLMGCDGCGKTTLARRLLENNGHINQVIVGKHLYRKSWIYKIGVIFIRPLLFQDREKYDETMAPLAYLRAAIGLRLKLLTSRGKFILMDRSIIDFLMVDRKSDQPRFCRFGFLSRFSGVRIPTVHFILPYERIIERKQEVTRAGHGAYDLEMFRHHSQRVPTDYMAFNNDASLDSSAEAAARIIRRMKGTR